MQLRSIFNRIFFITLLLFSESVSAEGGKAKIGVILPLSGDVAIIGEKVKQGIEIAAAEYSEKFALIYEDSVYTSSKAISAFRKLTSIDKVRYIIGPAGPTEVLPVAPLAQKLEIPLIAISLCDERYTQYPHLFCTYPSLSEQVAPLFEKFGGENKLVSKMAILVEESEIGNGYFDLITEFARKSKIEVVFAEKYPPQDPDLRSLLTRLRPKKPELLVVSAAHPHLALDCLQEAANLGIKPKYRWFLSEQDGELFAKHKELLEGMYMESIPTDLNPAFVSTYKKKYKTEPDLYHGLGYDAAKNLFIALEATKLGTAQEITKYLIENKMEESAIKGFDFKEDRSVTMDLVPSRFINGEQVRIQ